MAASYPPVETDTTLRDEGNAVHWLAQEVFDGRITLSDAAGLKAYNDVFITAEMVDHVQDYLNALWAGRMEIRTSFGGLGVWQVDGRADHIGWDESTGTLYVDDLKYGYRLVEPDMNWTLIAHAVGWWLAQSIIPNRVVLTIHQPRPYHYKGTVRRWEFDGSRLGEFYNTIAQTMTNPTDQLTTGLEWCGKCPALATCPAARAAGMNAIDAVDTAHNDNIDDAALAGHIDLLRYALKTIEARVKAAEELAMHRLSNGAIVGDYRLDRQFAQTRWKGKPSPEFMKALVGVDLSKPGLVTPAEAKRRGVSEEIVDMLTERPVTGVKLVRVDADTMAKKLLKEK